MSFEDFWSIYPRRVAKLAAKRKYEQALRHATDAEILAGALRYSIAARQIEMQFIKHPATWLHGGGWDDDMNAVAPRRQQQIRGLGHFTQRIQDEESSNGSHGQIGPHADDLDHDRGLPSLGFVRH